VKKNIAGILAASTLFTLACLCCPTNIIPFIIGSSTSVLPELTTVPSASATPVEAMPVCTQSLEQTLQESESLTAPGRAPQPVGEYTLISYSVNGDAITDPVYDSVPDDLKIYQQDTVAQQKIWGFITTVIPADQRTMVKNFVLYTDGINGSLGAVEQTNSPHFWDFEMDIIDGAHFPDLAATVIHEFAHLLTLNDSQITTDLPVFNNPDDQQIYAREAATCPTYFMYEGCSKANSYINAFFNRFWPAIYDEWHAIDVETDQDLLDQKLHRFYQKYTDQFVSEYAVTSPSEDLAESFMYFIFVPRPSGAAISEQKILFYYDYPELVSLRERILEKLCTYVKNQ
jgi:hypothetical protein